MTGPQPQYIVRIARADQFPPGTNLRDAARDSVIRYAMHHGLRFTWLHDQGGTLWRHGCQVDPIVPVYRSEALVTGSAR